MVQESWGLGTGRTWQQVVWDPKVSFYLRLLERGDEMTEKLKIFLRWARQQRQQQQQQQHEHEQQQQQQPQQGLYCVVCLDKARAWACSPCMHLCVCEACSLRLQAEEQPKCPVCRQICQHFERIYM